MKTIETLIIGGGPAGIQLGYFLEKGKRDYLIVEANDVPGSFFKQYPRHRTLISINKKYTGKDDPEFNLRHDWNSLVSDDPSDRFTHYSEKYFPEADKLLEYMQDYVEKYQLKIQYKTRVSNISRCEETQSFIVVCKNDEVFKADRVVVATGVEDVYIPRIEGIEYATGYESMSVNQEDYQNKNVLILGKGNSAFETADHLVSHAAIIHVISPEPLKFAWDSRYPGNLRAVNNNFLDTYALKSQNAVIDGEIIKMWKNEKSNKIVVRFSLKHAPKEVEQIEYDVVLRCTGFRFCTKMFDESMKPMMTKCGKLPLMNHSFESLNVPNLFFAGMITQMLDYKRTQSAFIHGFRYNSQALAQILEERFYEKPFESTVLVKKPDIISKALLKHFNSVSSLWQQVGFLTDILVDEGDKLVWIHNLPYGYVMENIERFGPSFYLAQMRLKPLPGQTFSHERSSDLYNGESSSASHPVVERFEEGKLVDTFHVLEDLLADWSGEEYVQSLACFFESALQGIVFQKPEMMEGACKDIPLLRDIQRNKDMKLVDSVL